MFYEEVFRELNRQKVKYVVAGGLAVNLYGIPRVTGDLDLLIDLEEGNVVKFSRAIKAIGYKPKMPVTMDDFGVEKNRKIWVKDKNMRVFSLWNKDDPYKLIDIFVENPIDFKKLYRDRVRVKAGTFNIPIVSIEHLIELKKLAGRKQDISDIVSLRLVQKLREK